MPNTHANITDLFDDIADAIREKDETTDPIVADTFPSRIRAIPSGGGTETITAINLMALSTPIVTCEYNGGNV